MLDLTDRAGIVDADVVEWLEYVHFYSLQFMQTHFPHTLMSVIFVGLLSLCISYSQVDPQPGTPAPLAGFNILLEQLKQTQRFETADNGIVILVKAIDEQNRWVEPTVMLSAESITIEAQMAEVTIDHNEELVTVTFFDCRVVTDSAEFRVPERAFQIPFSAIAP